MREIGRIWQIGFGSFWEAVHCFAPTWVIFGKRVI